jgi:membrane protein
MSSTPAADPLKPLHDWLWRREPVSRWALLAIRVARYTLALVRDLIEGEINLRAMSLVYTTLLSLVPLLALSFSVLKAFGVHNQLEPLLEQLLAPLGAQASVVSQQILGFVDNMKVGVLSSIGVGMLLYTSVSMISKIEDSFNFIWKIDSPRAIAQRFGQYLTVLIVGPVLIFTALGLTASVRNSSLVVHLAEYEPFGTTLLMLTKIAPYALIVAAFTFMYSFIPNTRVSVKAAAAGGLFAGIAWQSASVAFATFVAGAGSYSAIYSGFAIVIVLLIWLYTGWLIVLFGCRLAFYVQNPLFLAGLPPPAIPGSREGEFLAFRVMTIVAQRFIAGGSPIHREELQRQLAAPAESLKRILAQLIDKGALFEAPVKDGTALVPGRDPSTVTLTQLWEWSRGNEPVPRSPGAFDHRTLTLLQALEREGGAAGQENLRQWIESVSGPRS